MEAEGFRIILDKDGILARLVNVCPPKESDEDKPESNGPTCRSLTVNVRSDPAADAEWKAHFDPKPTLQSAEWPFKLQHIG